MSALDIYPDMDCSCAVYHTMNRAETDLQFAHRRRFPDPVQSQHNNGLCGLNVN